jgi:hypothetical protein
VTSATAAPSETSREYPNTIFVATDGDDAAGGTRESPLQTIQGAIDRTEPGDSVHVLPGEYYQEATTVRDGTAERPITITGPPDAVVHGTNMHSDIFTVAHSHIHLVGLTLNGLLDPDNPGNPESYATVNYTTSVDRGQYIRDLVIKPHAIGNVRGNAIGVVVAEDVEVGEFTLIGPAGLHYLLDDETEGHNGEIVYVGLPPGRVDDLPVDGYDNTSNIHIHHIDNSAGFGHSEIVNTKLGTHDVLVEYCTDAGGSQNTEEYGSSSIRLQSYGATVRWCDLRNGQGKGMEIGSTVARDMQQEKFASELTEAERRGGTDNAIYGNRVRNFDVMAFGFPLRRDEQSPDAQRVYCGNEYNGSAHGSPDTPCDDSIPPGDGLGHSGGDSPW